MRPVYAIRTVDSSSSPAAPGMARWRDRLFTLVSRNATSAADYFGLPPSRTVILGQKVEI